MQKLFLTLVLFCFWSTSSQAVELRLMTGPETGTYYQIGQETSLVTAPSGVHLQVLPSQGSWENIVALFNSDTEFAIFQIDAFARAAENLYRNTGISINEDIHVVMPLFSEEVHVIKARGKDLDFAKQKSFVVGCGPENGGSCLTAAVIEDVYDKQFSYTHKDYESAFDELRNGAIELVIVTAGKPYPLLVEQTGLDLVALPRFKKSSSFYSWTSLGPEDYPWLQRDVEVFAVRSVLATMIQEEEGLANDLVSSVHYSLLGNKEELKKTGHPKWNDVQFTGYIKDISHAGALRSLGVCKAITDFGYSCSAMVSGKQ
ncbi:TAXI family TRAP transporter solute-binding subunit [Deltaproteobacteria bacterium IMCC39524]|nr:TAXI family TRAP transporter solute-binding subunit [Deltaproteobacteria bacterium IMCC39524]